MSVFVGNQLGLVTVRAGFCCCTLKVLLHTFYFYRKLNFARLEPESGRVRVLCIWSSSPPKVWIKVPHHCPSRALWTSPNIQPILPSGGADEAGSMTLVDENQSFIGFGKLAKLPQRSHVSVHGEHAVCRHQFQTKTM